MKKQILAAALLSALCVSSIAQASNIIWVASDKSGPTGEGRETFTLIDTSNQNALTQPFSGTETFPLGVPFGAVAMAPNSSYTIAAWPTQTDLSLVSSFVINAGNGFIVSGFDADTDGDVVVAPDSQRFYVSRRHINPNTNAIAWYVSRYEANHAFNAHLYGDMEVHTAGKELAITRDGKKLYVNGNGQLDVIWTDNETFTDYFIASTTSSGEDIALSNDDTKLYIVDEPANMLRILNTGDLTASGTISVGPSPKKVARLRDTNKLYVLNTGDATVDVIDTDTDTIIGHITLQSGTYLKDIAFSSDGTRVYVLHGNFPTTGETEVTAIDASNDAVLETITLPESWKGMGILSGDRNYTPTGENVLVSPTASLEMVFGEVTAIGTTSATVMTTPPALPYNFHLLNADMYFDISTSATWNGTTTICMRYNNSDLIDTGVVQFLHKENGVWVDRTISNDIDAGIVCAEVTSLSPFAIIEELQNVVQEVTIDVRPNATEVNRINKLSLGSVPVAILSSPTFDARTIDLSTVRFADAPIALKNSGEYQKIERDVNKDGKKDIVVRFDIELMNLTGLDTHATLVGSSLNGALFTGADSVFVVHDPNDEDAE